MHHEPGDVPIVYDNDTDKPVDVSVKVVNTGQAILFVGPHVIPPQGPQRRPRVMRIRWAPSRPSASGPGVTLRLDRRHPAALTARSSTWATGCGARWRS